MTYLRGWVLRWNTLKIFVITNILYGRLPALNTFKRQHNYQEQKLNINTNMLHLMEGNTPVVSATAQKGGGTERIGGAHWPHDSPQAARLPEEVWPEAVPHEIGLQKLTKPTKLVPFNTRVNLRSNAQGHVTARREKMKVTIMKNSRVKISFI